MEGKNIVVSSSVNASIGDLRDQKVESVEIVKALLKYHPEYGGGLARKIELQPTNGSRYSPQEWIDNAKSWFKKQGIVIKILHGKLLIVALAEVDPPLGKQLKKQGFLRAVLNEIDLQTAKAKETDAENGEEASERESVRIIDDNPSRQDLLGRKPFAQYLADLIRQVRLDLDDDDEDASFLLHIDGRWGSGKTTMLDFLREALESPDNKEIKPWVVVDFNAWRYQRLEPPWWGLRQELVKQGFNALCKHHHYQRWFWSWIGEYRWRLWTAIKPAILTSLFFAILVGGIIIGLLKTDILGIVSELNLGPKEVKDWAALLGIIGGIWGLALAISRRLSPGSQRGAIAFLKSQGNPMVMLRHRFHKILKRIRIPVAIFIDDIDRCTQSFVVHLLEGIQTLFRGAKITYVVAGDRRWIEASFDKEYEALKERVGESGRPLGSLFLQKAFQVSLELPPITSVGTFWGEIIGSGGEVPPESKKEKTVDKIRNILTQIKTPKEIDKKLEEILKETPEVYSLWVLEALRRELDPDFKTEMRSALEDFHPLLERNPRSMKRFVNTYGIHRAAVKYANALYGVDIDQPWKQLALWTIVEMRWPKLAEHLRGAPEYVKLIVDGKTLPDRTPTDVIELTNDPKVLQVIKGEEVGVQLSETAVRAFYGFPPTGRPVVI